MVMNMLRERTIYAFVVALVALVFTGCQKESIDPNNPPVVMLDCSELGIDGGGGQVQIYYAVSNAIKGERPTAKSNVEWLTIREITDYSIVVSVAPSNVGEERFGFITVEYRGAKDSPRVYITQDKQLLNQFSFEVSDLTYKSCTITYKPQDRLHPYMANIIDVEYFRQSGMTSEQLFVEAEMSSYLALAQRNNMTLEELMSRISPQLIYTDTAVRSFDGMQPGAVYVVYSYGVEFHDNSYNLTTPIHYTLVNMPMPTPYDVKFSVNSSISNSLARLTISPGSWDGYYGLIVAADDTIYYVPEGTPMGEGMVKSIYSSFYTDARNAMKNGATAEQYLRSKCFKGLKNIDIQLEPGKDYVLILFAVESEDGSVPVVRSIPQLVYL